jgi:hypothetical protein
MWRPLKNNVVAAYPMKMYAILALVAPVITCFVAETLDTKNLTKFNEQTINLTKFKQKLIDF